MWHLQDTLVSRLRQEMDSHASLQVTSPFMSCVCVVCCVHAHACVRASVLCCVPLRCIVLCCVYVFACVSLCARVYACVRAFRCIALCCVGVVLCCVALCCVALRCVALCCVVLCVCVCVCAHHPFAHNGCTVCTAAVPQWTPNNKIPPPDPPNPHRGAWSLTHQASNCQKGYGKGRRGNRTDDEGVVDGDRKLDLPPPPPPDLL